MTGSIPPRVCACERGSGAASPGKMASILRLALSGPALAFWRMARAADLRLRIPAAILCCVAMSGSRTQARFSSEGAMAGSLPRSPPHANHPPDAGPRHRRHRPPISAPCSAAATPAACAWSALNRRDAPSVPARAPAPVMRARRDLQGPGRHGRGKAMPFLIRPARQVLAWPGQTLRASRSMRYRLRRWKAAALRSVPVRRCIRFRCRFSGSKSPVRRPSAQWTAGLLALISSDTRVTP